MPVQINEIVIKASVTEQSQSKPVPPGARNGESDNATIIKTCVEEVLRILKEKEER